MSATHIVVRGIGAVSPAGWGAAALQAAVRAGQPLVAGEMTREHGGVTVRTPARRVPEPPDPALLPKHPRLRRSSPVSRFAAAAAAEALGTERAAAVADGSLRLGIVCALMNGCFRKPASRSFPGAGFVPGQLFSFPERFACRCLRLFPESQDNAGDGFRIVLVSVGVPSVSGWGRCRLFGKKIRLCIFFLFSGFSVQARCA